MIEDGRIAELGSHDELTARGGGYGALYNAYRRASIGAAVNTKTYPSLFADLVEVN